MFRRFAKRRNCLTLRVPHSRQSDVQFRGRDQKVSALSFHVTLAQMRPARCWRLISGTPLSKRANKKGPTPQRSRACLCGETTTRVPVSFVVVCPSSWASFVRFGSPRLEMFLSVKVLFCCGQTCPLPQTAKRKHVSRRGCLPDCASRMSLTRAVLRVVISGKRAHLVRLFRELI